MPVVVCIKCDNRFKSTVKSMNKEGYFSLCSRCRSEANKTGDTKYLCIGVNAKGKQCGHLRVYNRKTCCNHHKQESKNIL
jgi:hypothetical protein